MEPIIAPSILSADFARLGDDVNAVLEAGADVVHFDVMDNHFVPNLTIGPLICEALRDHGITAPIDVHLMVDPVDRIIPDFANAGASYITFHPEASRHVHRTIGLIREHGCKAGLVFNPATPLTWLEHIIWELDMVLIMSVNPGFGGQSFIADTLPKIRVLRQWIDESGAAVDLVVDGGINLDTVEQVARRRVRPSDLMVVVGMLCAMAAAGPAWRPAISPSGRATPVTSCSGTRHGAGAFPAGTSNAPPWPAPCWAGT